MNFEGSFGSWLRQRRKALDLTRKELAQQVGCSEVLICKLEADQRRPSKQIAEKFAACLGVLPEDQSAFVAWARLSWEPPAPELPAQAAPAERATPQRINNLPAPATRLIGREPELAALKQHLLAEPVRLLTLVGPPGVGKTRLALQTAAELLDSFADGVCFVALAPIVDHDLVAPTIAQALGLAPAEPSQPLLGRIIQRLHGRRILLVLDNFEQILPAAALVGELLAACPRLTVLATSRSPLQVAGEQQLPVPPLPLPDLSEPAVARALADSPAVALFVARARAVNPGFALSEEHALAVAVLCARLDGLPLAIELIAARCKLLSPPALLARLNEDGQSSLRLLARGSQHLPPRQQTLYDAIRWSYDLLAPAEQRLFAQLAVFVGGWTIEAAEAVCRDGGPEDGDPRERIATLEGLESLLDKSLIVQQTRPDGAQRLTMLEMIRTYALEHLLAGGMAEALRRRHADFYLGLAETAEPHVGGDQQHDWLDRLEHDHDNIRAALRWALDTRDKDRAARLSSSLWRFWLIRGHLAEGRKWFAEALAIIGVEDVELGASAASGGVSVGTVLRAKVLKGAGGLACGQGDYAAAQAFFGESLALYRLLGDTDGSASALNNLGLVARSRGDYAAAQTYLEECLALRRARGERARCAPPLLNLGLIAQDQGDYGRAVSLHEESLALYRELGIREGIANVLDNLGQAAYYQGDYERAAAFHEESLALHRELDYKMGIATALNNRGLVARAQDQYQLAAACYRESLTICRGLGYQERIAEGLEGLAAVAVAQRQPRHGAWLLGCAERLRETIGVPVSPADRADYDRQVEALRAQLGPAAFRTAWDNGRAMTPEQVIAAHDQTLPSSQSAAAVPLASDPAPEGDPAPDLTAREVEVLRLLAGGLTNAEIAERLVVSTHTVNAHLRSIFSKLGVTKRTAAARYAIDHGLV
jgi:predicted ATPase/DNA-binding CsgD family transcriptional regulator/transcriptional regulator with XRE-family HTH domain/Tfp pilus assembly protein PilF